MVDYRNNRVHRIWPVWHEVGDQKPCEPLVNRGDSRDLLEATNTLHTLKTFEIQGRTSSPTTGLVARNFQHYNRAAALTKPLGVGEFVRLRVMLDESSASEQAQQVPPAKSSFPVKRTMRTD